MANAAMVAIAPLVRRSLVTILALVILGCSASFKVADLESLPEQVPLYRYTIAHRASLHQGLPDNSLLALDDAISSNVRFLEVDVRLSNDGELFLFHDGSLQTTNFYAPKALRGRRVQELSSTERATVSLDESESTQIPLLIEALRVLPPGDAALQLDLKGESNKLVDAVIELLRKENKLGRAVIQVRSIEQVARIRELEPRARILARCKDSKELKRAIELKAEFVELERWLTEDAVRRAHAAKIPVVINIAGSPYDKPSIWRLLRSRGVDSLMTNHAVQAR